MDQFASFAQIADNVVISDLRSPNATGTESQELEPAENSCTNLIVVAYSDSSQIAQSEAAKENHFGSDACRLSVDSCSLISSNYDPIISFISICLYDSICSADSSPFGHRFGILLCTAPTPW